MLGRHNSWTDEEDAALILAVQKKSASPALALGCGEANQQFAQEQECLVCRSLEQRVCHEVKGILVLLD